MHWLFLSDRDWSFSSDNKWLISPDANTHLAEILFQTRFNATNIPLNYVIDNFILQISSMAVTTIS